MDASKLASSELTGKDCSCSSCGHGSRKTFTNLTSPQEFRPASQPFLAKLALIYDIKQTFVKLTKSGSNFKL